MFCVHCGKPNAEDSSRYLTILAGCLLYVIVALVVRKRFDLLVPLREIHFRRRRLWRPVGALLMLIAFPAIVVGMMSDQPGWGVLIAATSLLGGILVLGTAGSTLRAAKISDHFAVFRGADEAFLRLLPVAEERSPVPSIAAGNAGGV